MTALRFLPRRAGQRAKGAGAAAREQTAGFILTPCQNCAILLLTRCHPAPSAQG